jgi:hypothetical protein
MQALDTPTTFNLPKEKCFQPDFANHEIYLRQCTKMERLYELVKNEF